MASSNSSQATYKFTKILNSLNLFLELWQMISIKTMNQILVSDAVACIICLTREPSSTICNNCGFQVKIIKLSSKIILQIIPGMFCSLSTEIPSFSQVLVLPPGSVCHILSKKKIGSSKYLYRNKLTQ